jgi:hypothetical protein
MLNEAFSVSAQFTVWRRQCGGRVHGQHLPRTLLPSVLCGFVSVVAEFMVSTCLARCSLQCCVASSVWWQSSWSAPASHAAAFSVSAQFTVWRQSSWSGTVAANRVRKVGAREECHWSHVVMPGSASSGAKA